MEENTKDSCCANGKCLCHKKWVKISLLAACALIIFLLGTALGSCCNRGGGERNFRGGNEQFGRMGAGCSMMNEGCPMMGGQNWKAGNNFGAKGCGMMNQESGAQKAPSTIKIQVAPSASNTPTSTINK